MKFIITVDTEEDDQWSKDGQKGTENVNFIPRFQSLAENYGFPPTYLVTYGMARDERLREILEPRHDDGLLEVGAHLHPWDNPPDVQLTPDDQKHHPLPHELQEDMFRDKMTHLTDAIREGFGKRPVSYRAGRWGFSAANARILTELDYIVDSSVTPNVSWAHQTGIPGGVGGMNYLHAPVTPYFLHPSDVIGHGTSGLLEVPITILFTNPIMKKYSTLRRLFRDRRERILGRALDRFGFGPTWFRPYPEYTSAQLIRVYETAKALDLPALVMMFHSSELMPGGSPYNPDNRSVDSFFQKIEIIFKRLQTDGIQGSTLGDFARSWTSDGEGEPLSRN